jgi:ABC-type bacteriocin/lantibiotic exporter with double-glycine peptidase domain
MKHNSNPVSRILRLVSLEKKEITQIYFYAIIYGIIMLVIPVGIQALISFAQTATISTSVVLLVIFIVLSVFISGVLQVNQMRIIEKIQQKIFVRYGFGFAQKIPQLNLSGIDNYYLPELVNRFFDTLTLQKKIAKLLLDFPLAIVQIIFGLILLSFYHPVFIAFGLMLVLVVYAILYFSGKKGLTTSIEESTYKYKVVAWLQEMGRIIRSVKFSKSAHFTLQKADESITGYLQSRTAHFKVLLLQYKTLIGFKVLVTGAMLSVGTFLMINQQLTVGQFIAAEIVILTILNSVEKLIVNLDSVYDVLTAVEKIEQVTDKESEKQGSVLFTPQRKEGIAVTIHNLSFGYSGNDKVVDNISLEAKPGEKICIAGNDGSGKSTLLRLLTGMYDDFEGNILFSGIPLKNYNLQQLRQKMGVMINHQDIFEGTLMENICMGLEDPDMEELMYLCKTTGLTEFLNTQKNGFDTQLNTNGRKLPATVIRKILLVRALINKPALLLLEEPWHGLETQFQQQIKTLLLQEMKNTTMFIISKDEGFAAACDKTIHMKNNKN